MSGLLDLSISGGSTAASRTGGTELGENLMREGMSMVDLADRPTRRTDWRLETDGVVTFSKRPPLFLTLVEGRQGVLPTESVALTIVLDAIFVILVVVGMAIFFFFAMPSRAATLRLLPDGVELVLLDTTPIFWPSLVRVIRGAFGCAILLVVICLMPTESTLFCFLTMLLVVGIAFLLVERAGLMLLLVSRGLWAMAIAMLLVVRPAFAVLLLVVAMLAELRMKVYIGKWCECCSVVHE
jgi:hypothetical protein